MCNFLLFPFIAFLALEAFFGVTKKEEKKKADSIFDGLDEDEDGDDLFGDSKASGTKPTSNNAPPNVDEEVESDLEPEQEEDAAEEESAEEEADEDEVGEEAEADAIPDKSDEKAGGGGEEPMSKATGSYEDRRAARAARRKAGRDAANTADKPAASSGKTGASAKAEARREAARKEKEAKELASLEKKREREARRNAARAEAEAKAADEKQKIADAEATDAKNAALAKAKAKAVKAAKDKKDEAAAKLLAQEKAAAQEEIAAAAAAADGEGGDDEPGKPLLHHPTKTRPKRGGVRPRSRGSIKAVSHDFHRIGSEYSVAMARKAHLCLVVHCFCCRVLSPQGGALGSNLTCLPTMEHGPKMLRVDALWGVFARFEPVRLERLISSPAQIRGRPWRRTFLLGSTPRAAAANPKGCRSSATLASLTRTSSAHPSRRRSRSQSQSQSQSPRRMPKLRKLQSSRRWAGWGCLAWAAA
jgi:chemotaxis protein histidine kinase CheA